jgi:thermitase
MSSNFVVLGVLLGVVHAGAATGKTTAVPILSDEQPTRIRADRLLLKLSAGAAARATALPERGLPRGLPEFDALLERHGITEGFRVVREHGVPVGDHALFEKVGLDRLYALRLPTPNEALVRELVRELSRESWVEYAEPVYIGEAARTVPNDPRFAEQWAHDNTGQSGGTPDADLDSPEAWDLGTGGPAGVVAILDTGADQDHEDLAANIVAGYDFVSNDTNPEDDNGHGTQASGIASARGNNNKGVAGVCWSCGVMPLKVLDSGGGGNSDDLADAMRYAADNGADTISMSLAFGRAWIQAIIDAADYAQGRGSLPFASAGNGGVYYPRTPAAYPNVVSVGGTIDDDTRIYDYGDHAEISAPSDGTLSTQMGGGYGEFGGTSAACPHAAGLGAMLHAVDGTLHVRELRHLIRLGADDGVGAPSEDTPGWDPYMGYGRQNSHGSLSRINGPWLALDRPHYVCAGSLTVALKDTTAGSSVQVTVAGSVGGDTEIVTVMPVTVNGYYEGSLAISWTGKDGPVVAMSGALDVVHGETITATVGSLSATASVDCLKNVCRRAVLRNVIGSDCDADGAADPGEIWSISVPLRNGQTEEMGDAVVVLSTTSPEVEILDDTTHYGTIIPFDTAYPDADGVDDPFRIRVHAGAATNGSLPFSVTISGRGWESDVASCQAGGSDPSFSIRANRDLGPQVVQWSFDAGTNQGFTHAVAHGTGNLSECTKLFGSWRDSWNTNPVTDRSHSGSYSMRLGTGTTYSADQDAGLVTPSFTVPAGGGAIGFYMWMSSELASSRFAWDGMIVEAKRPADPKWTFLADATYNTDQNQTACDALGPFPFGTTEVVDMLGGDGSGTLTTGDTFDREHLANLSDFAGSQIQVRFRFGADNAVQGTGTWVDTVTVYGAYTADAWPGGAPAGLQGTDANCPASFELSWNAVPGAGGYRIYRSTTSCQDALERVDVYGSSATPGFSDSGATQDVQYYYAVEATEAGPGCPTERSCTAGGCFCAAPLDPTGLGLEKSGADGLLTWDDPSNPSLTWNVYRDTQRDPSLWGPPHASGVTDQDPGQPGIQYRDVGALDAPDSHYYKVTAVNACGESPL